MNYYAEGRSPALLPETVQIFSRPSIYGADRTTNEGKIDAMSGTLNLIAEHSNHAGRATAAFREEVTTSMLSESGLQGEEGSIICPFMKIAFSNAIDPDYKFTEETGKTTLFDRGWDGKMVFTDTKTVSDNLISRGLIAGYTAPGATIPQVVPLESSLARKEGRTWKRFNPSDSQLPSDFIADCFTPTVREELERIRTEDSSRLKTPVDPLDRQDMAAIAILCNTHFLTLKALNKHTEKMHGGISLRRLPPATPIPASLPTSSSPNPTTPTAHIMPPTTHISPQPFHGLINPGTMTDFLAAKLFEKAKKGMSAKEVSKRWSVVTRKMTNELGFTQPDGTIYKNYWGDVVIAATKFFDEDQHWVAQLKITATRETGHDDVFTPNYHGSVTTHKLDGWIQKSWEEQNRSTTIQKIGKLMKYPVPSKNVQVQLNTVSQEVRERIGANTEVLLPVRIPGKPEIQKALVNISQLLATFHLSTTWESY